MAAASARALADRSCRSGAAGSGRPGRGATETADGGWPVVARVAGPAYCWGRTGSARCRWPWRPGC